MANNCTYKYKAPPTDEKPEGEELEFKSLDDLRNHLLSDKVNKEDILSHIKSLQDATTSKQIEKQESDQQTSVGEHTRTGAPRDEKAESKIDSGDSGGNGQGTGKEKEVDTEPKREIGIKNAAVYADRAERGLRPIIKQAARRFGKTWQDVRSSVINGTTDPRAYTHSLAERFKNGEKIGITDRDNAIVLMDRIDLTNQRIQATDDLARATQSNNDNLEAVAWQRLQEIEAKLQQNDEVADRMGTEASLALGSRRALANMDYSLIQMKKAIGSYYSGGVVPPEMLKKLEEIEKQHNEAVAKLQEYEEKWKQQQADAKYQEQLAKNKKEPKAKEPSKTAKARGKELADKVRALRPKTDAAQANILGLPIAIYDTALVTVANVLEAGGALADAIQKGLEYIKDNNPFASQDDEDAFVSHLKDLGEKDPKEHYADKIAELAKNSNAETITKDMITPLRQLINEYAKDGNEDFQSVLEQVYGDLKDHFSDLSLGDVRDAYSGYGDVKLDTKSELQKKIQDWKNEAKQWSQMQDIIKDNRPSKGNRNSEIDPELKKKREALERRMKEAGITWEGAPNTIEEKNQRALDSLKKRLQTEIEHLTNAIEDKSPLPEKGRIPLDDAAKQMKKQRDALKDILNTVLGKEDKKTLTDEDRIKRAQNTLEKQISSLEDDVKAINDNTYEGKRTSKKLEDPTLDLLRGRKEILQELKRKLVTDYDPKSSQSNIALEKYKDSLRDKILEYSRRIETKDFDEAPPKQSFANDAEAKKLEMQVKQAQVAYAQQSVHAQKQNRTRLQKIYDRINAWKRFGVLTGIPTIGKLGMAVAYRSVFNPVEEMTGGILHYVPLINTLSNLAPREGGGLNIKAEKSALYEWAKAETYKDAMRVIKTGQGELDYRFGKYVSWPPETLEAMGRIHGSLKNFAKRSEFARSYEKRMRYAIEQKGANPGDELTQLTAMSKAYEDANRAIFMQKNWLTDKLNDALKDAENNGNIGAKTGAAVTRFLIPIMKIPANFVAETLNYTLGSARVVELIGRAVNGHLKDMSEDDADSLMRSLKKGSVGVAAMAIGYNMPNMFGGYYYKGRSKNDDDVNFDQIKIGDFTIPSWATHFPLFEVMQLGATIRRVQDAEINKGKESDAALHDGIVKSGRGLLGEVPLFSTPEEVAETLETGDVGNKLLYPQIGSMIPLGVQQIAKWTDDGEQRKPEGFAENMEYRIPGLRNQVPTKDER
jgi:hypothetical protein